MFLLLVFERDLERVRRRLADNVDDVPFERCRGRSRLRDRERDVRRAAINRDETAVATCLDRERDRERERCRSLRAARALRSWDFAFVSPDECDRPLDDDAVDDLAPDDELDELEEDDADELTDLCSLAADRCWTDGSDGFGSV